MAKRTVAETLARYGAPQAQQLAPSTRREAAVRRVLARHRDPMEVLAEASDKGDLKATIALIPYIYPALKAMELSGPEGKALQVQVVKLIGSLPQPQGETGDTPASPTPNQPESQDK